MDTIYTIIMAFLGTRHGNHLPGTKLQLYVFAFRQAAELFHGH